MKLKSKLYPDKKNPFIFGNSIQASIIPNMKEFSFSFDVIAV